MEGAMRILILAAFVFATVSASSVAVAQAPAPPDAASRTTPNSTSETSMPVSDALLTSIVTWLSTNFDLKPTALLPTVKNLSAAEMTQRRYRTFLGAGGPSVSPSEAGPDTVAIYDRNEATIYLPLDWSGQTPAEISVLVHEMVHHLQHVAQSQFECPQAREQLAYAAQQRWLSLFGRTLEDEFRIDPFTLLVATRCMY
jgi:hypothetical protein